MHKYVLIIIIIIISIIIINWLHVQLDFWLCA